jgi:hypothetical protein
MNLPWKAYTVAFISLFMLVFPFAAFVMGRGDLLSWVCFFCKDKDERCSISLEDGRCSISLLGGVQRLCTACKALTPQLVLCRCLALYVPCVFFFESRDHLERVNLDAKAKDYDEDERRSRFNPLQRRGDVRAFDIS